MKVILKVDIKGTGKRGEIVKVSDGYARNMLIPKGMAVEATQKNMNQLKKDQAQYEAKIAEEKAAAQALAKKLESLKVNIKAKSGEDGKLFGSITNLEIAKELMEQHGIEIDKKKIVLPSPIKQKGTHVVEVKLYTEVPGKINVEVVDE